MEIMGNTVENADILSYRNDTDIIIIKKTILD
jgi:hypothetical protein